MTTLSEVKGINKYCGPAVLAVLTGESTDKCAAVISAISGKQEIKAVQRGHLKEAFKRLRFDVMETNHQGSSLYGVLFRMREHSGLYVVFVPHHVIAVEINGPEIYICDNHRKTPLDIRASARLMQKVEEVWQVKRREPPKLVRVEVDVTNVGDGYIRIYRKHIYENEDDNVTETLGFFRYESDKELEEIATKINDVRNL